jgi:hypothetical protein
MQTKKVKISRSNFNTIKIVSYDEAEEKFLVEHYADGVKCHVITTAVEHLAKSFDKLDMLEDPSKYVGVTFGVARNS